MEPDVTQKPSRQRDRLLIAKSALLLAAMALGYLCAGCFLKIPVLYESDPAYVRNVFTQGRRFQLETSEPFRAEVRDTLNALLDAALIYQDLDNFANASTLQTAYERETANANEQIRITKEVLAYAIAQNEVIDPSYEGKDFVRQVTIDGTERRIINDAAIEAYFYAQRGMAMENYKLSDANYFAIKQRLGELRGVSYAVYDRTHDRVFTNTDCTQGTRLYALFAEKPNALLRIAGTAAESTGAVTAQFCKTLDDFAAERGVPFDVYFAFDSSFVFDPACETFAEHYADILHQTVTALLWGTAALLGVALLILLLLRLCGKRTWDGEVQRNAFDRLPNELHLLLLLLGMAVQVAYAAVQLRFILHPTLIKGLQLLPDLFLLRTQLCAAAFVFWLSLLLCWFRRQRKTNMLWRGTLLYRLTHRKDA